MIKDPTNFDILQAVNKFANNVEERFQGHDKRFDGFEQRFDGFEQRFDGLDNRLKRVEALMVTKDYLDDKLADLRGDLVVLMRKEDKKLQSLIHVLQARKVISEKDVKQILALDPFPRY